MTDALSMAQSRFSAILTMTEILNKKQSHSPLIIHDYPQDFRLSDLSHNEARVLLSLVIISGGSVNLSDKLTLLNEQGLDLLRRTVAAKGGQAGMPLDLLTSERPSCWLQKIARGHRVLLINWKDRPDELGLDLAAHGIRKTQAKNFWTDRLLDLPSGSINVSLAPHSCALFEL